MNRGLGALSAAFLFAGCVALGWRLGPGASLTDPALFAAPPVIERRGDAYLLVWTQGSYPFFFAPSYEPIDGRLVFALGATSSSGNLAGRRRELPIEGARSIEALRRGGAFWWERSPEPDGTLVPLRLVEEPTEP